MTLPRTNLSYTDLWCWQAVLESFGVTVLGEGGQYTHITIAHLERHGYTATLTAVSQWQYDELTTTATPWKENLPTVTQFIAEHPTGDYLLTTAKHVMSLRDGQLTDTETDAGGRRRVRVAYQVERAESAVAA